MPKKVSTDILKYNNQKFLENIYNGKVDFTSNDSTTATSFTSVDVLTTKSTLSSLFNKVSIMFKNIRYLYNQVTQLNNDIQPKSEWVIGLDKYGRKIYQTELYRGLGSDVAGFAESSNYYVISFGHDIPNVKYIISCNVVFEKNDVSYRLPYYVNGVAQTYLFNADKTLLRFYNKAAFPDYYIHALITYIKDE